MHQGALCSRAPAIYTHADQFRRHRANSHDNPEWAEFCHWIHKIQLPTRKEGGEVIHNAGKQTSEEIVPYASPAPPKDTGKHRYVLLVLEGGKDGKDVKGPSEDQRKKWGNEKAGTGVQKWAEENGLTPIGEPTRRHESRARPLASEQADLSRRICTHSITQAQTTSTQRRRRNSRWTRSITISAVWPPGPVTEVERTERRGDPTKVGVK